jgi:hypothetical protein
MRIVYYYSSQKVMAFLESVTAIVIVIRQFVKMRYKVVTDVFNTWYGC